jgi:TatD DNase family protein
VTFENASEVREAAKSVPIERIMVETDAPYSAPAPNRTKRCEPAFIRESFVGRNFLDLQSGEGSFI